MERLQSLDRVETLRRALFFVLLIGMSGTGFELLLLGHTEGWRQWIPLALIFFGLAMALWHGCRSTVLTVRVLQVVWLAFVVAGVLGMYFHYQGGMEFKLESNPALKGWDLVWQVIHSKAPPLLAPGALAQLGLVGLIYTYKHPLLGDTKSGKTSEQGD